MKFYSTILALIASYTLTAQIDFKVSTLTGYETNINRAPSVFESEDGTMTSEDLFLNSLYQDAQLYFRYRKDWGKSSLTAYLTPEIRYYYTEPDASQLIFNSRLFYKFKIRKNFSWESNVRFKIKDREGQNLDQNELNLPFGYKLIDINSGLRFRMSKSNRTLVKLFVGNKEFDNSIRRSIDYNFYGIEAEIKNIQWKNHLLHSYGVTFSYTRRDYDIINFSDNSDGDRTWNYLNAGVFYRYPISKKMYLEPRISYEQRKDVTNTRFGYNQIRPQVIFNYKTNKMNARVNVNYRDRKFTDLTVEDEEGEDLNLKYNYWVVRSTIDYSIRHNMSFLLDVSVLDRKSNNEDISSTAFRSYSNNYYGFGIRYKF